MTALSLEQQRRLMLHVAPRTRISYFGRGKAKTLWMELAVRPTAASATYRILVKYTLGRAPLVWVTEPLLVMEAHGRLTPHLYSNGSLCLFDPAKAEWTDASVIAYTILPWTLRWLFHYEHWLVFGDWRGDPMIRDVPAPEGLIETQHKDSP